MPIEVKKLGLQPKVVQDDAGTFNASMVESEEITATGKEIHDPEFAKLLDKTAEWSDSEAERKSSIFGMERISTPDGKEILARGDKIDFLKSHGYGKRERTGRMVVPALPWQRDRRPGERYADYMARTQTVVQFRDGRRLVHQDGALHIEGTKEA